MLYFPEPEPEGDENLPPVEDIPPEEAEVPDDDF